MSEFHTVTGALGRWTDRRCVALVGGVVVVFVAGIVAPTHAALPPDNVDPSRGCTIIGTSAGNILKGTDGDDVICGGGGGDTIYAGAGNDVVYGDAGGDTIHGGDGDDVIYGGDGGDAIYGEGGDDRVFGGAGGDTVRGGAGDDMLDGEDGADTLRGGDGKDRLIGGLKADTAWGDGGDDLVVGGEGADSVKGNAGDDVLLGGPGLDSHYGDTGTDTCVGGEGINAFYSCESKRVASDFGGVDGDLDGDGVSDEDEARAGTDPLVADSAYLTYALDVSEGCDAALALSATAQQDIVTEGETALFDVVVRNDPVGTCLASADTPATVAGTLTITAPEQSGETGFEDITAWLEVPDSGGTGVHQVLPSSSGLTASETEDAAGCPGGTAEGCALIGESVGYVNVAEGRSQQIGSGQTATIQFRYFPTLGADDLNLLSGGTDVRLAVAVIEQSGHVTVLRTPVTAGGTPLTGAVTVDGEMPGGSTSQVVLSSLPGGQQAEAMGAFAYQTGTADGHSLTAHFTATAQDVTSSATADAVVVVESDRSGLSALKLSIYPKRATVGVETEFLVSARPSGVVGGEPQIVWESGSAMLVDDGTGGDLIGEDNVFTTLFSWAPTTAGVHTLTVSGIVDGRTASDEVEVAVYPDGVPAVPYTGTHVGIVGDGASEYYSDMVDICTEPGVDFDLVEAAAASVGGVVVGSILLDGWQIQIPPVDSLDELVAVVQALAANPVVVLVEPEGLGSDQEDTIQPNDPEYPNQQYLDDFGMDDAWAFNTGRVRTVVAVLDGGFDVNHADLDDTITAGWDFGSGDDDVAPAPGCPDHGTHVAGIIGAEANNGIGVTGVNWNVELLVQKVAPDNCKATGGQLAEAISASIAAGARIINISYAGYGTRSWKAAEALEEAFENNVAVVAAAGNLGSDRPMYPAAYERTESFSSVFYPDRVYNTDVLAVGAMDSPTQRRGSSNYGDWVQFWAPGTEIKSTVAGGAVGDRSGTSMAAPFVSGLASLIVSHPKYRDQGAAYVRSRLQSTSSGQAPGQQGWVVDGYQAVSNASFEAGMATVEALGTVSVVEQLGSITPGAGWGHKMLELSTGPGKTQVSAHASLDLALPVEALSNDDLQLDLCYNYVTTEYPDWIDAGYNDQMHIAILLPGGGVAGQIDESVDLTNWTAVPGINSLEGGSTVGESGWKCASIAVPAASLQQPPFGSGGSRRWPKLAIMVEDVGDASYDSAVLIDNITVTSVPHVP
ncbi:MAG: S8 family serine peptidase [Bifidobacteriaceae bacterium]|jgi:subtilisin family serine protease|nr:S8 family serine peptidase [Bifidobacteriaceae bacterium]